MEHEEEKLMIHPRKIIVFSEDEIKIITSNYSTPIGSGGFGHVYRGVLDDDRYDDDGPYLVAVKRYKQGDSKAEFVKELVVHATIDHKNIVKLTGYCIEGMLAIVTEYISKGNLDDALHNSDISIPLDIRLGIAIGCATALNYMHSIHLSWDSSLVYHGDIKPANILLDDNLMAKVSDFGLSRFLSGGNTENTNNVIGSEDYMDLIYRQTGCLTPRSDVYSFGAFLLELIARRRVKEGNKSLISSLCKTKWKVSRELFDAEITNESSVKILEEIARLATECLDLDISKRPKMDVVIERLQAFWRCIRGEQDIGWRKKTFTIFKRTSDNKTSWIQQELCNNNVRILTKEELNQVTQNYSDLLSRQPEVYKGRLEDNTLVVVKKITGLHF